MGTLIEGVSVIPPSHEEEEPARRPIVRPRLAASIGVITATTSFDEGTTRTAVGLSVHLHAGVQVSDYASLIVEATLLGGVDGKANQVFGANAALLAEATLGWLQLGGGVGMGYIATLPTAAVNRFEDSPLPPEGGPGAAPSYHARLGITTGSHTRFDRKGFVVTLRYDLLRASSPVHVVGLSFGVQRF